MATIFLHLEVDGAPVHGDSTTAGFEKQIEIESVEWALKVADPGKDKASTQKARSHWKKEPWVELSKYFDKASTRLLDYMYQGTEFDLARITVATMAMSDAGRIDEKMLVLELKEGRIEQIDANARESNKAMAVSETLTLSFKECTLRYHPADARTLRRDAKSVDFPMTAEVN